VAAILVVDDSAVDRRLAAELLKKAGHDPVSASSAMEALEAIGERLPDVVLTDLIMPEISGLELVKRISESWPAVPVILMTAHGSEELAVEALRSGAASYVPKRNLARDLGETVQDVLAVAHAKRNEQQTFDCLLQSESRFALDCELVHVEALIGHLQDWLKQMKICGEAQLIRVGAALHEALVNAIEHGNLELDSKLREDPRGAYYRLAKARSQQPPYCDRRVHVVASFTRSQATFTVQDEGPGFDPSILPDPRDPANLEKVSGRGLLLIRTFMDDVRFNERGNQITMVKRRDA
jgi:CheY-like chemotaxis protein